MSKIHSTKGLGYDSSDKGRLGGFTIVELLVVIVVIGILAAIIIVSYTGISGRAIESSLQSDLTNASKQLKLYQAEHDTYPTAINCSSPGSTEICIRPSGSNTFAYFPVNNTNPVTFSISATQGNTIYRTSSSGKPKPCPYNFIAVPGSSTYGTSDFCVMKYEARQVGSTTTPISQATGNPWANISQTTAITNSQNVANCTGCHLITEAEWLTIAQNVLSNPSNWSGGAVGSGSIYSGHNDSVPASLIAADPADDGNGYINTGNSSSSGANQRRTLTLTNGEIIWDLVGNAGEWTSGTSTTGQPGIASGGYDTRQWTAITTHGTLSPDPFPATTGLSGASGWNSSNGIGVIYSNADETNLRGFLRGGPWNTGSDAGVLALFLYGAPSGTDPRIGFRVAR